MKLKEITLISIVNGTITQGIPQSAKAKDLEIKGINALDQMNIKVTKNDIETGHRLCDSRKKLMRFDNRIRLLEVLKNKKNANIC